MILDKINKTNDFLEFDKDKILSSLDKNKDTILVFTTRFHNDSYSYVNGFIKATTKILESHFNVIYFGYDTKYENYENSLIRVSLGKYATFIKDFCKRKKDEGKDFDNSKYNDSVVKEYVQNRLSFVTGLKYITCIVMSGEWLLALQRFTIAGKYKDMWNEFHDYSGNDKTVISDLKAITKECVDNIYRYSNPLAFSLRGKCLFHNCIETFIENSKNTLVSVDTFINDPGFFYPYFNNLPVKNRNFYFANDNRGTRNFEYFPIGELQHLVYDLDYKEAHKDDVENFFKEPIKKINSKDKKCFIFMGSILNVKGVRINIWKTFLKDLKIDNSKFYIPPVKQGIAYKYMTEEEKKKKQEHFTDDLFKVLDEIESHPLYGGYCLPEEVPDVLSEYKYTLVLRCVSISDSLNYRPVLYTYKRILFFLDYMYDPSYLQIPKCIQDKIVVHNSDEIKERILYYETHPAEREVVLDELWEHFNIDKWLTPGYAEKEVMKYFS